MVALSPVDEAAIERSVQERRREAWWRERVAYYEAVHIELQLQPTAEFWFRHYRDLAMAKRSRRADVDE